MSNAGTVHIIGAGLAGLSAAVHLSAAGRKVKLYEAGQQAGGRCRSYHDKELNARIDNGNHLMLSCNEAVLNYLHLIGAEKTLHVADKALFPFMDMATRETWQLNINRGVFPSWIFNAKARVPDTNWRDYLNIFRLVFSSRWRTVAGVMNTESPLYKRLIEPLTVAILNTAPQEASARMLGDVLFEAFETGGKGCRPMTVKEGLSESFVDPARAFITQRGGEVQFGQRLRELAIGDGEIRKLIFAGQDVMLDKWDWVVLALPAWVVNDIAPAIPTPTEFRAIVNAHFKVDHYTPRNIFTGLIGGAAEWVFEKDNILSTTTSAAEKIVDLSAEELAKLLWQDVAGLYGLNAAELPVYRIVKEKRATFAATPEQIIRRPTIDVRHANMVVCGDWTNTKLPSTIEGAIRSGRTAASKIIPPVSL